MYVARGELAEVAEQASLGDEDTLEVGFSLKEAAAINGEDVNWRDILRENAGIL